MSRSTGMFVFFSFILWHDFIIQWNNGPFHSVILLKHIKLYLFVVSPCPLFLTQYVSPSRGLRSFKAASVSNKDLFFKKALNLYNLVPLRILVCFFSFSLKSSLHLSFRITRQKVLFYMRSETYMNLTVQNIIYYLAGLKNTDRFPDCCIVT